MQHHASRIVGLYRRHGLAWETLRREGFVERAWIERFLGALPRNPEGARILDIGCGGAVPIARHLAKAGCRITGIDTAPALLALARLRLPQHHWLRRDMRRLALGERFDGILAWDSLFHLSVADQRRMIPRLRRHAAPGAVLLFSSGPRHGEAIGQFAGEPMFHASLAPPAYRRLLAANRFRVLAHVAEDPGCGGHTVWLVRAEGHSPTRAAAPIST
ncbi:class I SAM-dependent DNA methyltransferase [Elioraea rosea]|uniref:class I SAM-dependent DNA methyltransferase n=1 Tax=Elioraea rosea TaxID=2492390 RepID=UPI001185336A|nr:class I SAM-dependent methyltransferase [Elioraea rosea]